MMYTLSILKSMYICSIIAYFESGLLNDFDLDLPLIEWETPHLSLSSYRKRGIAVVSPPYLGHDNLKS